MGSFKCNCPGNACGHIVNISGNYAKKCDFRKKNDLPCDITGKQKAQNKENLKPCSCPGSCCGLLVQYAGNFADGCCFRKENALPCDATGKMKERDAKRKAALIAPPSLWPVSNELSNERKANAVKAGIVALNAAIAKERKVVGDKQKITHAVFLVSCAAPCYGGVDNAPNVELTRTSLTTRARPQMSKSGKKPRKKGRQGSIVIAVGLNYKGVSAEDARALYSHRPATIISDCGNVRDLAEHVERELQEYVCENIIQPNPESNKRLWRKNGNGGANSTYGPFKVCYGAIVHRPDDEADERYPNASIWSRTLPVRNAIFKDDIHEDAIHTDLIRSVSD